MVGKYKALERMSVFHLINILSHSTCMSKCKINNNYYNYKYSFLLKVRDDKITQMTDIIMYSMNTLSMGRFKVIMA